MNASKANGDYYCYCVCKMENRNCERVADGFLDGVAIDVNRFQSDVHTNVYQCTEFKVSCYWIYGSNQTKWNTGCTLYAAHGWLTGTFEPDSINILGFENHLYSLKTEIVDAHSMPIIIKFILNTKILDGTIIDLDYMNFKRGHCGLSSCYHYYSSREIFNIVIFRFSG